MVAIECKGDQENGTLHCIVPHCRMKKHGFVVEGEEWICNYHWKLTDKRARRQYKWIAKRVRGKISAKEALKPITRERKRRRWEIYKRLWLTLKEQAITNAPYLPEHIARRIISASARTSNVTGRRREFRSERGMLVRLPRT